MKEFEIEGFDQREYQTVVLAALLHDIGKFLQRMTGVEGFSGVHQDLGADFVSGKGQFSKSGTHAQLHSFSDMIDDDWIDKDKLEHCIRKHHKGSQPWGWIVHKADSYSTKERFKEAEGVTKYPPRGRLIALKSVFASVDIGNIGPGGIFGYNAATLDSFQSFPEQNKDKLNTDEARSLFCHFIDELLGIDLKQVTFDKFYVTLLSIFEKYLWCLPCHTHPVIADVSIFDHLKSSSAIAACLYQYHHLENTLQPKYIKDDNEQKFLLVGGDLSGIQKYVYQISAVAGEGGVAKRLRARSFYISALVEVTVIKILRELNLPLSCNLLSAGGKFIILAPNNGETIKRLKNLYKKICDWLLKEFSGEISLAMDWSTAIKGADFYRKKEKTIDQDVSDEESGEIEEEEDSRKPRECNFRDRLDKLWLVLENKKLAKFKTVLVENNGWCEKKFIRSDKHEAYGRGIDDCRSCKKFPAEYQDPHESEVSEKILCKQCAVDKIIGRKLLDAQYLAIGQAVNTERIDRIRSRRSNGRDSFFFFDDHYFISLLKDYNGSQWENDFILVQRLRDHKGETRPVAVGSVHRFLANYTPFFENYAAAKPLCYVCKEDSRSCDQIKIMSRSHDDNHLYTFGCIAASSSEMTDIANKEYKGNQLIGVLKADVDNLGLIFSEGLKNRVTVSRYLTMSRMLDLFFSGWMYRILKETTDYREIYTGYSGGDDLVLVGPWEKIINFAQKLNQEFRRFTCKNENITLSAGIAVVQPKYPIAAAVGLAEKYLERSKAAGKNSVTFFDTTVTWSELDTVMKYKDTLNEGYEKFSTIFTTQFIHRLLAYNQMYLDSKNGDITKLIFHSRMHYDVRRNLMERVNDLEDKEERKWFNENILELMLQLYRAPVNEKLMKNLKIPVYWILYKNRKYKKGGKI